MSVRKLIQYVKTHNKFYRNLYYKKKEFEDLPFIDKKQLLEMFEGNRINISSENILTGIFTRVTSGTTNQMGMFNHSETEIEQSAKRFFDVSYYLNKKKRDSVCIIHNYSLSYIFARHMLTCGCFVSFGNPYDLAYTVEHIKRTNSNVIRTSPTLALKLAPILQKENHIIDTWILAGSGISKVADTKIRQHSRRGVKIVMQYGMAETLNSMYQPNGVTGNDFCLFDNGDFVYEFLDEDNNKIAPGETGELVITRVSRHNPIIRYRTGDLFKMTKRVHTNGGRVYSIVGRTNDQVKINGVTIFEEYIDKALTAVEDYITGDYSISFDDKKCDGMIKSQMTVHIERTDKRFSCERIARRFQAHFYLYEGYTWEDGVNDELYLPVVVKEKKFKNINKQKKIIDKRLSK
jgi:phenylacetate-CoA ligase